MEEIVDILFHAAKEGGRAIDGLVERGVIGREVGVNVMGDRSLLADIVAEEAIFKAIRSRLDSFVFFGEERGIQKVGDGGRYTFVVDPVDGSFNLKRGLPFYTISIALVEGRTLSGLKAGLVYAPRLNEMFWAVAGRGAYHGDKRLSVHSRPGTENYRVVGVSAPPKAGTLPLEYAERLLERGYRIRVLGSASYEACMVARGLVDGFVDLWGTIRVVDLAASIIILRESGAKNILDADNPGRVPEISVEERLKFLTAASEEFAAELLGIHRYLSSRRAPP